MQIKISREISFLSVENETAVLNENVIKTGKQCLITTL